MSGFFIGFALALLLWFAAYLFLKAFVRRRTSPDYILGLLQEEVRELEADIDEKTEQNLLLLEEKIHTLRELCGEAERRIAVYTHELENRDRESLAFTTLGKKPLVERLVVQDEKKPPSQPVHKRKTKQAEPAASKPLNITRSDVPLAIQPRPMGERITELQSAGFSPELIAKRLDINVGEVELYFRLAEK